MADQHGQMNVCTGADTATYPNTQYLTRMKANEYVILSECIETGVNYGWRRALKYLDMPDDVREWLEEHEVTIKDHIDTAVNGQICEYFKFDEPKED
ncbi:MAG: hypothetical protein ACK52I_00735 [Pseudomonadota bacterium]|jgi:hypothetical protein